MKLLFGVIGALMMITFLASFVIKLKDPAMITVAVIGVVLMIVDLWQARDEADT